MAAEMDKVTYVCADCKAEDTMRVEKDVKEQAAINCWKCHAGHGLSVDQSVNTNKGMFPLHREAEV